MMPKPKKEQQVRTHSTISCCHHCVPPKRHTACWGHCPEYLKEKAEYEERKTAYYGDPNIKAGLNAQQYQSVSKAMKARKNAYRDTGKGRFAK